MLKNKISGKGVKKKHNYLQYNKTHIRIIFPTSVQFL